MGRKQKHPHIFKYHRGGADFYRVSFQLMGHQIRKQGFSSFQNAEEWYHAVRRDIRSGEYASSKIHKMKSWTLTELYEHYKKTIGFRRSISTQINGRTVWKNHIGPELGKMKPSQITRRVLARWVDDLRAEGIADNTIKTYRAELSNCLKLAHSYELIDSLPVWPKLVARPKMKTILSPDEIRQLLSGFHKTQYRVMALVQYQLGLRCGELLGLTPGAFNFDEGTVLIDKQYLRHNSKLAWEDRLTPTKTGLSRYLPISDDLIEAVRPYVEHREANSPLWISTLGGWLRPVRHQNYDFALKTAAKRAGITKPISTHCLRASMLDWLVNHSGLNIHLVSYFSRNSAKVLVSRYSKPDTAQLFEVFGRKMTHKGPVSCELPALEVLEDD